MFGSGYIRDLNRVETSQNYSLKQQQDHDVSLSSMQQQIIALAKEQDTYIGLGSIISDLQARMLNEEKENLAHTGLDKDLSRHEEQIKALERAIFSDKILVSPDRHIRP